MPGVIITANRPTAEDNNDPNSILPTGPRLNTRAPALTLVTGGGGFVGLNVLEHLLDRGDRVISLGPPPPQTALERFAHLSGQLRVLDVDVCDGPGVWQAFANERPSQVVHAAAITAGESREKHQAQHIVNTNVQGSVNVLEAARHHGVKRMVYLSSAAVYGAHSACDPWLYEATTYPAPESLYAITKFAAERIALRYRTIAELDVVVARLSAVFGRWEHDTGVRDTLSPPYWATRLAAAGRKARLPQAGWRDWIYGPDIGKGIAALLDTSPLAHSLYNLSTGTTWSMSAWCDSLRTYFPAFSFQLETPGDARLNAGKRSPLAVSRLTADTGFESTYSMKRALDDYLDWRTRYDIDDGSVS